VPCFLDRGKVSAWAQESDSDGPLSLVNKQQLDMSYDLKTGWKPQDIGPSGAPIPLCYNFDQPKVTEFDKVTGLVIDPCYLGHRYQNSI